MSENKRLEISKDWCLNMAQKEGDAEIGAGLLALHEPEVTSLAQQIAKNGNIPPEAAWDAACIAIRFVQERRASSPAAGKSADHEWDSFSNKWVPKPNAPAAGRDAVIEECARVADEYSYDHMRRGYGKEMRAADDVALAIRALKETPNGN